MEKRLVQVGHVVLGEGQPKVCIPVMGEDLDSLAKAAADAVAAQADIIELRADSMHAMPSVDEAKAMCRAVREAAPGIALLFTLRTKRDGGSGSDDVQAYEALLGALVEEKDCVDAIDVELSADRAFIPLCEKAKACGIPVIGSCHHFEGTPDEDAVTNTLMNMARLGADVSKIAVMPKSRLDVLTLMRAAVRADEQTQAPIIAIAMGAQGVLTRVGGEAIGSCLTFGTAGQASAPGQIDALVLRGVLEVVHKSI